MGVEDLLGAEDRVVRVVLRHDEGQRARLAQELGHRRLDRGQLRGVVQLGPEEVKQQVEDGLFGLAVPHRRERAEGLLDRGHLALAVLPRRQHGEVHVIPALGQVAPAGRAPVEHGDRVAVGPVEVLAQVAQQLEAAWVATGVDPGQDVGPGRRLGLEVPPDHRRELVQRLQHREVQLAEEVGGEHQAAMPVDHERFHVVTSWAARAPPACCLVWSCGGDPVRDLGHNCCRTRNAPVMFLAGADWRGFSAAPAGPGRGAPGPGRRAPGPGRGEVPGRRGRLFRRLANID